MFQNIAFSEIIVIAIVLLIVVGPERLPRVAKTIGILYGRLQRFVASVKVDLDRELQLDELRKLKAQAQSFDQSVHKELLDIESGIQQVTETADNNKPLEAPKDAS